ncbi:O-antigen ligase family protein [Acinetobacter haemolyticus]|uniref:O-antigen ligase family protein n=1 Tax=Acinetobacter haemolyticus TaxID=29430 RepID=UPI0013728024|nr:O-antigen ligase family protein [Acinetobacter haemolyticus]NAS00500.1 O-antigen ligase domain-containing protein [Acinetobacter haemolyticus]
MIFNKSNLSNLIFFMVVIDILILPYFPFFAINNLFFLIFFDFLFKRKLVVDKKIFFCFLMFVGVSLISTVLSFFNDKYSLGIFSDNLKRFFQLILFYLFYFYFYNFFSRIESSKKIILILDVFFVFVFFWSIIYYISLDTFLTLKNIFNSNDSFIERYYLGENQYYRFSYIWTDPNNIAYAILGVFVFCLFNLKLNINKILLYFFVVLFVCLNSMSTSAWLILLTFVLPCFIYRLNIKNPRNLAFIALVAMVVMFFGMRFISNILASDVAVNSFERFQENNIGTESGGSRFEIWSNVLSYYNGDLYKYIFWGQGYQLHYNDILIKPHNGILLIFFAYGFFALIFFMYTFFKFKINKKYFFIIPFFLCFFINVMIGELKLFLLYIFLLAFVRAESSKRC